MCSCIVLYCYIEFSLLYSIALSPHHLAQALPSSAPWTTVFTHSLPSGPRADAVAVTVGNKTLIAGGRNDTTILATVDIYDPTITTDSGWKTTTLSVARTYAAVTTVDHRWAIIAGGLTEAGVASDTVDLYDDLWGNWSTARLSVPRYHLAATAVGDRWALFAGGTNGIICFDVVDLYDAHTGRWSVVDPPLSVPRERLAAIAAQGTRALFAGGRFCNGNGNNSNSSINGNSTADVGANFTNFVDEYLYNDTSGTWTATAAPRLSRARAGVVAVTVANTSIFCGGFNATTIEEALSVVDMYDAVFDRWFAESLAVPRSGHAAVVVMDRFVLITGGEVVSSSSSPTSTSSIVDLVDVYDDVSGNWSSFAVSGSGLERVGMAATTTSWSTALFAGGYAPPLHNNTVQTINELDFSVLPSTPTPKFPNYTLTCYPGLLNQYFLEFIPPDNSLGFTSNNSYALCTGNNVIFSCKWHTDDQKFKCYPPSNGIECILPVPVLNGTLCPYTPQNCTSFAMNATFISFEPPNAPNLYPNTTIVCNDGTVFPCMLGVGEDRRYYCPYEPPPACFSPTPVFNYIGCPVGDGSLPAHTCLNGQTNPYWMEFYPPVEPGPNDNAYVLCNNSQISCFYARGKYTCQSKAMYCVDSVPYFNGNPCPYETYTCGDENCHTTHYWVEFTPPKGIANPLHTANVVCADRSLLWCNLKEGKYQCNSSNACESPIMLYKAMTCPVVSSMSSLTAIVAPTSCGTVCIVVVVACSFIVMIVLALIIAYVACFKSSFELLSQESFPKDVLPNEILWSFKDAKHLGDEVDTCKLHLLSKGSETYRKAQELFHKMGGEPIQVVSIYTVYTKNLVNTFVVYEQNLRQRLITSPNLFTNTQWQKVDPDGLKRWVKSRFDEYCLSFSWNTDRSVVIIPQIHGTDYKVALSICKTGFVTLALLDAGFYGKGIYFTSHAVYATPYVVEKKNPTLIISYVIPGNPYPVTENPNGEDSLIGAALKTGVQSHYVITTIEGVPVQEPCEKHYDELVITQEAQVLPAFLVLVDPHSITGMLKTYERPIVHKDGKTKITSPRTMPVEE